MYGSAKTIAIRRNPQPSPSAYHEVETVRIGKFQFRPGWATTVGSLLLLPLFTGLGLWQLDRADQKRALVDHFEDRAADLPVQLDGTQRDPDHMLNRRVLATGRYAADRQLLLDNRIYRSRPGYQVLTPFRLSKGRTAVLVNRGWVPLGADRNQLPDIEVDARHRSIAGLVHKPSDPPLLLGDSGDRVPGWPKVIQRLDIPALEQRLDVQLLPYTVRLSPEAPDGYVRDWRPNYRTPPEKHQAYAVQWFGFAVLLAVLYLALNLRPAEDKGEAEGEK